MVIAASIFSCECLAVRYFAEFEREHRNMLSSFFFSVNVLPSIGTSFYNPYMRFQIRRSINNVYQAYSLDDGRMYTARIKGKVMKKDEAEYSPVAVGDIAIGEPYSESEALISGIEERKSYFRRWNTKRDLNQTIAANQDMTAIVTSPSSPPFRPRFLDRAIASSFGADILIILNKADDEIPDYIPGCLSLYESLGFSVLRTSSRTGEGISELRDLLKGRITAFVGQSGVGKSTLINTIVGTELRTGEVSYKYNRGRHTTNHALFIEKEGLSIIDTPGVREIEVPFEELSLVKESFPEFSSVRCRYDGCLHHGEEGCVVPSLVEDGTIDGNRYDSYLRILSSLEERKPFFMRNKK